MREDILARGEDPSLFPILNSKPDLYQDLLWIWEGFMVLSSARQIGMGGPQPIAFTEIASYLAYANVRSDDDREEFVFHVQKLDLVFQADYSARNPSTGGKGKPRMGGRG